jgi:hypothetical protein
MQEIYGTLVGLIKIFAFNPNYHSQNNITEILLKVVLNTKNSLFSKKKHNKKQQHFPSSLGRLDKIR